MYAIAARGSCGTLPHNVLPRTEDPGEEGKIDRLSQEETEYEVMMTAAAMAVNLEYQNVSHPASKSPQIYMQLP